MSVDELDQAEIRRLLEGLVAVLQTFREHAPRISVTQVQATLITALETMDTQQGDRLPTVGDYAQRLGLSPSGASRLMGQLSTRTEDGAASLVRSDRGPATRRSEAFILTEEGRKLVVCAIETISGRRVDAFETHNFLSFAVARHGNRTAGTLKIEPLGPKTLLVSPRQDALSSEVMNWCIEHHGRVPEIKNVSGAVEMEFATEDDAFEFRMTW